jgi:hypothetical protein
MTRVEVEVVVTVVTKSMVSEVRASVAAWAEMASTAEVLDTRALSYTASALKAVVTVTVMVTGEQVVSLE